MVLPARVSTRILICVVFVLSVAGCTTIDRKVDAVYKPSVQASGGSGDLYLTASGGRDLDKSTPIQWILGKVKNSDGETIGNIVTPTAPADLLLQAFTQELTAAGYRTRQVGSLPEGMPKGVDISNVTMEMEEVSSVLKDEVKGRLTVAIELWKNGTKIKRLDYKVTSSDFSVKDRDRLAQDLMEKSLQDIMKQAVPDVIKVLEEK